MCVGGAKRAGCKRMATEIDASKIVVERNPTPGGKLPKEELEFGATFTDHMLICDWNHQDGWLAPRIIPFGNMQIHPAASAALRPAGV